jgi:pimeloyl-ACP methyl ester carboxylesterase
MKTRDVLVDGIRIHLVEAGEGPTLFLLHGLSASHDIFVPTIAAFAERWRVIAPDLPGHGRSGKPNAPYTVDFFAGMMRSLGRELGVREAVVVGNSIGGQVAVELAATYPAFTRALVLVAPAGSFGGVRSLRAAIGVAATDGILRKILPSAMDLCFYDPMLPACIDTQRLLEERLAGEDFPGFARAVVRSLVGAMAAGAGPLERVSQPTLVVWGRNDRLVSLAASRRVLTSVPHARLVVLDRCGHLPMLEQPVRFNRAVADFLRAVAAAPLPGARRASGAT